MDELRHYYKKYKKEILPAVLIIAGLFIIMTIVVPQWNDVMEINYLVTQKNESIDTKKATLDLLNSNPDETVNSNYSVVATALPPQKDIALIYNMLNKAASDSNVILGGFSVNVGDIYSTNTTESDKKPAEGVPFLNLQVNATGDDTNLRQFAKELYKSVPLLEIQSINISNSNARYDINFYYKNQLTISGSDFGKIESLTEEELKQIEDLKSFSSTVSF